MAVTPGGAEQVQAATQ